MNQKLSFSTLFIALAVFVLNSVGIAHAQGAKNTLRIAMLAPRGSIIERDFKKLDRDMRQATNNEWGIRIYASGVAGDDKDVIRKMRVGQMDSAIVTTTGLSQVVREVAILDTPGIVTSYDDLKKIEKEMWGEWQKMFLKDNVKLIGWYPAGRYRTFTKGKIENWSEVKNTRPWLLPESYVLKELWRASGATGVPLGIPDVYGALQTGMVNAYVATCVTAVAMQWHTKVDHMQEKTAGVLLLTWVMNKDTWDKLPKAAQDVITKQSEETAKSAMETAQREDEAACQKLLKRGFGLSPMKGVEKVEEIVRDKVTGRVFSKELRDRLEKVTEKK